MTKLKKLNKDEHPSRRIKMDEIEEFIFHLPNLITCEYCNGKGYRTYNEYKVSCLHCKGYGKVFDFKNQKIEVSDLR